MNNYGKISFKNKIIIIGFGSIGRALLPVLFKKFDVQPSQINIIANDDSGIEIVRKFNVPFELITITAKNYISTLDAVLNENDFLINLSVDVSSLSLIEFCNEKNAFYMDTSTEPWKEQFCSHNLLPADRTNYMLREHLLKLKNQVSKTAILTHGANPGLISHFLKQALLNMANDNGLNIDKPKHANDWAELARRLDIKVIHVAERDTQISSLPKIPGEFVNTWSVPGLIAEGLQPAELGWGTHERHWPRDAHIHEIGCQSAIFLNRPGADTQVRSWTPSHGSFHGFLITHPETSSIAEYLTIKNGSNVEYRPTVHYAYCPCPDAVLSLLELRHREWRSQPSSRLICNDVTSGIDELGVLLMGNKKGAYWFGSTLSIEEARQIAPFNNATSLQVVAGVVAGMMWALEHPNEGLVEPECIDHQYILDIALPYLGEVAGYYTEWTPLHNRELLFSEELDHTDPWQFINIRVN
ncbi:MAG: saccharopine dehydrogenase C-terminal domain-containing protein [Legionellaceae bacterium]|nr:saccharopine dehydrogenase C-terminal domain-containing protein [Legionellaceae bacterium]